MSDLNDWLSRGIELALNRLLLCKCFIMQRNKTGKSEIKKLLNFINSGKTDKFFKRIMDSKNISFLLELGETLFDEGKFEFALKVFDQATKIDPIKSSIWSNKGECLNRLGRYNEANDCFNNAINLDPNSGLAFYNKATLLERIGNHDDAIIYYNISIELYKEDLALVLTDDNNDETW